MALYSSETPHFFKIILAHTLKEQKLNIPKKFVRKYGNSLQINQICLKMPCGAEWNVGLEKSNNNNNSNNEQIMIWFQKGWQDFVDFYSVKLGYFLVFRYDGNSCFHVVIFDHSALEIQYPVKNFNQNDVNKEKNFNEKGKGKINKPLIRKIKEEFEDDCPVPILDRSKRGKNKTQITPCSFPNKKMKTNQTCSRKTICDHSRKTVKPPPSKPDQFYTKEIKTEEMMGNEDLQSSKRESKVADKCSTSKTTKSEFDWIKIESKGFEVGDDSSALETLKSELGWNRRTRPLTETEARLYKKASTFKSKTKKPSFIVTMRPSYMKTGRKLGIPTAFSDIHLKKTSMIVVQVSDGRGWPVTCRVRYCHQKKRAELGSGWKRFVRDNNLQVGDICVFEMFESTKISLKTTIFRNPRK